MEKIERTEKSDKKEIDRKNLELVLEKKVKPLIKDATERFLGVNIDKLNEDITSTLTKSSIGDIKINYSLKYKQAKKQYKKDFLSRILILHLGNISEAAKLLGLDRRTLHRLINEFKIDIKKIKYELLKPYNIKIHALSEAIEDVLQNYKTIIHPKKASSPSPKLLTCPRKKVTVQGKIQTRMPNREKLMMRNSIMCG